MTVSHTTDNDNPRNAFATDLPHMPHQTSAGSTFFEEDSLSRNLGFVLVAVAALGCFVALLAIGLYVWHFFPYPLSGKHSVWGEFGDFIGGTLNPLFSFLALIALLLTLWVQSRELAASRATTRRAARSAELTAELTAINHLITYYDRELEAMSLPVGNYQMTQTEAMLDMQRKRKALLVRLQELYAAVTQQGEG